MTTTVKFLVDNDKIRILSLDENFIQDTLAPAVYTLRYADLLGYYLVKTSERFHVPNRLYGSVLSRATKVMTAYASRTKSTGVLLSGDKGSGKTMLSAVVGNQMIEAGRPVILIEAPYSGSAFNKFLSDIGECCLFFDEFGKIYSPSEEEDGTQQHLLSVFDGANSSKRLILFTENTTRRISDYMLNRPGRIFYHFRYHKIEASMIREYCADLQVPSKVVENIVDRMNSSFEFSFDVLQAIVEDYKRFGDSIEDICAELNIEQPIEYEEIYEVHRLVDPITDKEMFIAGNKEITVSEGGWIYLTYHLKNPSLKSDTPLTEKEIKARKISALKVENVELSNKHIIKKQGDTIVYSNGEVLVEIRKKKKSLTYLSRYL